MYSFKNDYSGRAHPEILKALTENNNSQEDGYGLDSFSLSAAEKIRELTGDISASVHLLSSGTQTNLLAVSSFLRPHEAVISAETGHIAVHETGAIEATGHKVISVETDDGKLNLSMIFTVLEEHHFEHMVKPRLVYISNPTELGTVYSRMELEELYSFCRKNNLYLYIDGARLGSAVMVKEASLTLKVIHDNCDAFFIGGTKNGALLGEALVICNDELKEDIRYMIKQKGALLSKGRVLGVSFNALFNKNLYFNLSEHSNRTAQMLADELKKSGCSFLVDSPTNQIFPILKNTVIEKLSVKYDFYIWKNIDKYYSAVRLITSWATEEEAVRAFISDFRKYYDT